MNIPEMPELCQRIASQMIAEGVGLDDIKDGEVVLTEDGASLMLYIYTHGDAWTGAFLLPDEVLAEMRTRARA